MATNNIHYVVALELDFVSFNMHGYNQGAKTCVAVAERYVVI